MIGGGILAKELTTAFSTLGEPGVRGILSEPPFPVMGAAYRDKELTPDEIFALIAFLEDADKNHAFQQPRDYGLKLFLSGLVGVVLLLGFYSILWRKRRRQSVYQEIYDRQIESR